MPMRIEGSVKRSTTDRKDRTKHDYALQCKQQRSHTRCCLLTANFSAFYFQRTLIHSCTHTHWNAFILIFPFFSLNRFRLLVCYFLVFRPFCAVRLLLLLLLMMQHLVLLLLPVAWLLFLFNSLKIYSLCEIQFVCACHILPIHIMWT